MLICCNYLFHISNLLFQDTDSPWVACLFFSLFNISRVRWRVMLKSFPISDQLTSECFTRYSTSSPFLSNFRIDLY